MPMCQWQQCLCILLLTSLTIVACDSGDHSGEPAAPAVGMARFAGSAACRDCHADISESHLHTAHFQTSSFASAETIMGSFEEGRNLLDLDGNVGVLMERRDSAFYQTGMYLPNSSRIKQERFDIVTGSGRKGQTYLYWKDSLLFQLPVSYHTATDEWVNSPGFDREVLSYYRLVGSRCLECHSTYFHQVEGPLNAYDTSQVMVGITCEKCHGPAAEHVAWHRRNPSATEARHIINTGNASRDIQVDLCALCHSGIRQSRLEFPPFSFIPGHRIDSFFVPEEPKTPQTRLDVHGNQVGLLRQSACYTGSDSMTCTTCHDVHRLERDNISLFSQRCMQCHPAGECGQHGLPGLAIEENCIDCHMPNQESRDLVVESSIQTKGVDVRSHRVAIYPEESKRFLEQQQ